MLNLSRENEFDLHENKPVGGAHFHVVVYWFRMKTRFDTGKRQLGNGLFILYENIHAARVVTLSTRGLETLPKMNLRGMGDIGNQLFYPQSTFVLLQIIGNLKMHFAMSRSLTRKIQLNQIMYLRFTSKVVRSNLRLNFFLHCCS